MQADPLLGQVGRGWALEISSFLGPKWKWHSPIGSIPFHRAQNSRFPGTNLLPLALVMYLPASKNYARDHINHRCIKRVVQLHEYSLDQPVYAYSNSWSEVCTRCGIISRKAALVDPWLDQQLTTLADLRRCSLDMTRKRAVITWSTDMQLFDDRTCSHTWSTDMQPYLINGHAALLDQRTYSPTWSTDMQPYLINGHAALLDQRTCSPTWSCRTACSMQFASFIQAWLISKVQQVSESESWRLPDSAFGESAIPWLAMVSPGVAIQNFFNLSSIYRTLNGKQALLRSNLAKNKPGM